MKEWTDGHTRESKQVRKRPRRGISKLKDISWNENSDLAKLTKVVKWMSRRKRIKEEEEKVGEEEEEEEVLRRRDDGGFVLL